MLLFLDFFYKTSILCYFLSMENNYLHKIDIKSILKETGLTLNELAQISGIARSNNLKKWEKDKENGGARPSYNTFVRLLQKGATVETLFGVEYNPKKPDATERKPIDFKDPKFLEMVKDALAEMKRDGQL